MYTYVYIEVCVCVHKYVMYVHTYICMCYIHTCIYVCICLCRYVCTRSMYWMHKSILHANVFTLYQCRQQQLQFRPPLEEIRAKYYREMKKFVCIPNHFRGVVDSAKPTATIFPRMIDRNPTGFLTVYKKVSILCNR